MCPHYEENFSHFPTETNIKLLRATARLHKQELVDISQHQWLDWCESISTHTAL